MSPQTNGIDVTARTTVAGRARRGATLSLVFVAAALALASCSSPTSDASDAPRRAASTTTTTSPPAVVEATVADGATDVPLDQVLGVTVDHGTIEDIELTSGADEAFGPERLDGVMNDEATAWMGPSDHVPSTRYRIDATVKGADGATTEHSWGFTTGAATHEVHTSINAGDGMTYGIGMPIIVTINTDVPAEFHQAVVDRLRVTSEPAVEGGWRWFSDSELHWRPAEFWPAHTDVHLDVDFAGLKLGPGVWGVDGRTVDFSIGDAHVSTVDAKTHQMTVNVNGETVKTFPVSTGRPGPDTETRSGIHVVNEKSPMVIMDSSTIGIPNTSPEGYLVEAEWSVRISNSGEFVHSAPWSTGSQGSANVSHGCVNLAPADAEWFYNLSLTGDVVAVVNTDRQLEPWNGYGDWQIPWAEWVN